MRHRVYGKHLGRDKDQRRALFKGLINSLILFGSIQTSEIKAKAIKGLIDKVINLAKNPQSANELESRLPNKSIRDRLIQEIVPNLGTRTSGYTQIVRLGTRQGDQTTMVKVSLFGADKLKPFEKELTPIKSKSKKLTSPDASRSGLKVKETVSAEKGGSKEVKSQKLKVKRTSKK